MESPTPPASKALVWTGRIISALPVTALLLSGAMKLAGPEPVVTGFTQFGYDPGLLLALGIVEIACTLLYLLPQTAGLGAILLTGYLGGAVATHLRVGDAFIAPIILGVLVWVGLVLRDARLRALLPFRG